MLTSRRPSRGSLAFRVPYAYHFADLLKDYDNITHDDYRVLEQRPGTPLCRLFRLPACRAFYCCAKDRELYSTEHRMGTLPERLVQDEIELKMVQESGVYVSADAENRRKPAVLIKSKGVAEAGLQEQDFQRARKEMSICALPSTSSAMNISGKV